MLVFRGSLNFSGRPVLTFRKHFRIRQVMGIPIAVSLNDVLSHTRLYEASSPITTVPAAYAEDSRRYPMSG